jgi:hypothetical protein
LATLEPFFNQSALTAFIHSIDTSIENSPDSPFRCPAADCSVSIALNLHRLRQLLLKWRQVDRLAVEEVCASLLAESVASVDQRRAVVRQPMRAVTRQAHRDLVDAARLVLACRFHDKLSPAELVRSVFSSPFHLARVFRRETGLSLHRHLTRLRLRHALEQTRWSTVAAAKSSRRYLRFPFGDRGRRCFLSHWNESGTVDFSLARSILSLLSASIRIALAAEL